MSMGWISCEKPSNCQGQGFDGKMKLDRSYEQKLDSDVAKAKGNYAEKDEKGVSKGDNPDNNQLEQMLDLEQQPVDRAYALLKSIDFV